MVTESERWNPPDPKSGLLIRNQYLKTFLKIRDYLYKDHGQRPHFDPLATRCALFCLSGHLGDTLNAFYVIRAFRKAYPHIKIVLLASRWMKPILNEYQEPIDEVIWFDHWIRDRSSKSTLSKIIKNATDFLTAYIRISELNPSIAFDLHYFWPNAALLLQLTKVHVSAGFIGGGGRDLYKYPLPWRNKPISVVEYMAEVVISMGFQIEVSKDELWKRDHFAGIWASILKKWPVVGRPYVLIHPGTGSNLREWSAVYWKQLIADPVFQGINLVLAGTGSREGVLCQELSRANSHSLDLCDKLNFREYLAVVANANHVIGLESLCGHLASALGVRSTLIYPGVNVVEQWRPWGAGAEVITYKVPCAPCQRSHGCMEMECMTQITANYVVNALRKNASFQLLIRASGSWSSNFKTSTIL